MKESDSTYGLNSKRLNSRVKLDFNPKVNRNLYAILARRHGVTETFFLLTDVKNPHKMCLTSLKPFP